MNMKISRFLLNMTKKKIIRSATIPLSFRTFLNSRINPMMGKFYVL